MGAVGRLTLLMHCSSAWLDPMDWIKYVHHANADCASPEEVLFLALHHSRLPPNPPTDIQMPPATPAFTGHPHRSPPCLGSKMLSDVTTQWTS